MGYMGYNRVIGRRCYGIRGFKLNSRRFSVQKLNVKFLYLFKIFIKSWKSSFGNVLNLLKKNFNGTKQKDESYDSNRNLVSRKQTDLSMYGNRSDYKLKSYARSNSFYAEAIADCLDFIKRNSLSIQEKSVLSHIER
ncbi:hypothetical protein A4A49_38363 [Nicotiana attenuata]|uniref:Uncharacterized protein n=1 Tax=Nicotiana attenuata TaxID=49451 RepID=A0A1J6KBV7_NICAT|nr:hypothetical protein A4A49_38363 [Nicotiana attenuata]